jgi:hypothetical protein
MTMRTILGVLVIAVLIVGCGGAASTQAPAAQSAAPTQATASTPTPVATLGASPSSSGAIGIVHYQLDGAPATTEVDVVADGGSVSGTAVTTFRGGTHTVRLGCATQNGDTWALGGTTEQTTVAGERAGDWSAVIVKNGPPQQIGIWLGDDPSQASDCEAWLASIDFATIGAENFSAVESGSLVPPPDLAP